LLSLPYKNNIYCETNGEPASEGTYFYVLTYQDEQGTARRYHGSFTLVR
jgi:hypothetical protein